MNKKPVSMEALRAFVRKEGPKLLKDKNVTSVGIGYKITKDGPTKEISIQFTVARKPTSAAELESMDTKKLPKFYEIDGVKVPTDVLEREYKQTPREVKIGAKLQTASARKSAVDPIVPGVSIGHPTISAGTAGCVVYDSSTGSPYILSNWHVLHGEMGQIGDNIVQPGRHDDDRVDQNVVGRLVRSHLGLAGDCAIASIDQRQLSPDILGLDVAVSRLGEAELGDHVVKSGRTTDVTYGIVNRVDTIAAIGYGEMGVKNIGCIEIGPDPEHPAARNEISMGGDSGSVWLHLEEGGPSDMMLGLHFAGEVGDAPDHALACYPGSVFEKLQIRPAAPAAVGDGRAATGYSARFVGTEVPLPRPANVETRSDLLDLAGNNVFDYTHFSLAMSRSRRLASWVAWNIDGGELRRLSRRGLRFKKDPNLPAGAQIGNELYADNPLDRGHVARRADLVWGTLTEAKKANAESFYFTNITPQHEAFNRSSASGIWGQLENAVFEDVDVENLRVSVMGGPIFADNDPAYRGVQLPRQYWKVVYFREVGETELKAKAYMLTQADLLNRLEVLELPEFSVYEVPVARVSEMTGMVLPGGSAYVAGLGAPRPEAAVAAEPPIRLITSVREIIG